MANWKVMIVGMGLINNAIHNANRNALVGVSLPELDLSLIHIYTLVKRYRALDEHGKKMVDFALDEETARMQACLLYTSCLRVALSLYHRLQLRYPLLFFRRASKLRRVPSQLHQRRYPLAEYL